MSIIDELVNDDIWLEYLEYKKKQVSMSKYELRELEEYIVNKKYKNIVHEISCNSYEFSIPTKHLINKINKEKKRVVYSFNEDENMVLKIITYIFTNKYDYLYSDNCYSFRRNIGIKNAVKKIIYTKGINKLYGYKIDVSNYFNSINVYTMINLLEKNIDDKKLILFLKNILLNDKVLFNNKIISEKKGIMAGTPIAVFLSNIYLKELDDYFKKENILYFRYSDDILFFCDKEKFDYYVNKLNMYINKYELNINPEKVQIIYPNDRFDFLGFGFQNNVIDISNISLKKIKGKIKRSSRKIRRWMEKKNVPVDKAIKVMIRKYNKKFFQIENKDGLTWALWYFPIINTSSSLKKIDSYLQQNIRFISTGRYTKKNYNIKYVHLKELGYRTLVNEFYKFKDYSNIEK